MSNVQKLDTTHTDRICVQGHACIKNGRPGLATWISCQTAIPYCWSAPRPNR